MIEHLSKLDPGTSPLLGDMMTLKRKTPREKAIEQNALSMTCPICHGRQRLRGEGFRDDGSPIYHDCPRCGGTGRRQAGYGVETRSKKPAGMDPAAVAFMVAGMPPQWYDAAWLAVTGCTSSKARLDDELINYRMPEIVSTWEGMEGDEAIEKTILLCTLATWHLARPMAADKEIIKYRYIGVGKTSWFGKWRHRYRYPRQILLGYVDNASEYMAMRYFDYHDAA